MKILGTLFIVASIISIGVLIFAFVYSDWQWNNSVLSYWSLADKSSTIQAKADYIDKFVLALKSNNLADNDALIFKTADNNCENNIKAVSTLQGRLEEIKGMNPSSFEYQQAIQQITAQEQGQADSMLSNLNGCWLKTHWYSIWNPLLNILWLIIIGAFIIFGIAFIYTATHEY
jgi:hypothetical protein